MEVGWFERPEFKNLVEGIWKMVELRGIWRST